ncbi:MAG: hypothetical protein HZT41_00420 [Dechloromonas sp.]|nr:MAG: hypothetical protein HZT41_00420 [Dechloromonas sp.]
MNTKLAALLAALALAATAHVAAAGETHEHGHGAGEVQKLRLDAGRKWATDAPLRQAMDEINRALAEALPLIHRNRFDDAHYRALAATVNSQVAFAVDNCHLEPKADAMLHLVIADLVAGAGTMQGAAASRRTMGPRRWRRRCRLTASISSTPAGRPQGLSSATRRRNPRATGGRPQPAPG